MTSPKHSLRFTKQNSGGKSGRVLTSGGLSLGPPPPAKLILWTRTRTLTGTWPTRTTARPRPGTPAVLTGERSIIFRWIKCIYFLIFTATMPYWRQIRVFCSRTRRFPSAAFHLLPLPTFLGNVLATGKPYRDVHCLQTPSLEATTSSW